MKRTVLLLWIVFLFACRPEGNVDKQEIKFDLPSKLDQLLNLPQDTVLDYYDLSNDFLLKFPDLSGYTIRELDLSHNYLDTLNENFLPKGLKVLDLSYNYLSSIPFGLESLEELYLSHNNIRYFYTTYFIDRIDISHNNLKFFLLNWSYRFYYGFWKNKEGKRMSYLNISYNPNLSNEVLFVPSMIDTIIHDHIANQKKLRMFDVMGEHLIIQ